MLTTTIITEWEPGRRVAVITQNGPAPVTVERSCTPIPGGTRMTYQIAVDVSQMFFFRVFRPIVGRYYQKKVQGYLRKLKVLMEKG